MVQKYTSPVRVYKYPFELIMRAYEFRFPTCDMIPVVKETEVIDEEESEDKAVQVIDRRAKLSIDVPYLLKKIMGVEYLIFRQKNTLNRRNRTLHIDAWNESFSNRVVIKELCTYSVHPENPDWTCFEQSADLDIKSFFGFEGSAEKIAINEYSKNIAKSKDIMEHYVNVLAEEGITYIEPWDATNAAPATEGGAADKKDSKARRKSSVREDASKKLEQDYIQMYLGELSPIQESQLVQLKQKFKGNVPNDSVFLRFLRAREFNVEKAREMLSQSIHWRKKHGVDKILDSYEFPQVVKEYFPGSWHHHDKEGRPVFVLRLGQMDVKGIIKSIGEEGLIKLTLHICEEGLKKTEDASHRLNRPISTWTLLLDLDGLNMRHLWRPGMKALLHIIEICESNYPETLGRVLTIRAPRVFPILWTLVSPLIDETSREKFLFYSGTDYQDPGGLIDYIDHEYIPDFLGGICPTKTEGGIVPKTFYMSVEEFVKDQSPGPHFLEESSSYHSVSLRRYEVHEGIIHVAEKGSVICWDFDVLRHDVCFTVFRLKNPLPPISEPKSPLCTTTNTATVHEDAAEAGASASSTNFTFPPSGIKAASDTSSHVSVIEKLWKEGSDFFKVENSIICHDGESIQGSHVTSHSGTYVLQWKFFDRVHGHHFNPIDDVIDSINSITQHKAKILFFFEVLNSGDYKGSMTSLQSCQSGFSTISKASKHSTSGISSGESAGHSDRVLQLQNSKD